MKKTQIAILSTVLGSTLALAACQSTTPAEQNMNRDHHCHHTMQRQNLSPEQRAEWQAKREQRLEQREQMRQHHQAQKAKIEQACQGKRIGERVNIQWNNRVIEGTCEVRFSPDQSQFKRQMHPTT